MDVEVQKRIAEEIERKNIDENMTMAMEQNPESFAQVVMLWINLKVNGHHVKGLSNWRFGFYVFANTLS